MIPKIILYNIQKLAMTQKPEIYEVGNIISFSVGLKCLQNVKQYIKIVRKITKYSILQNCRIDYTNNSLKKYFIKKNHQKVKV